MTLTKMTLKAEVSEFKRVNGNSGYTDRDMLMYLCSKVDKIHDKTIELSECHVKNAKDIYWIRIIGGTIATAFFSIFIKILFF